MFNPFISNTLFDTKRMIFLITSLDLGIPLLRLSLGRYYVIIGIWFIIFNSSILYPDYFFILAHFYHSISFPCLNKARDLLKISFAYSIRYSSVIEHKLICCYSSEMISDYSFIFCIFFHRLWCFHEMLR